MEKLKLISIIFALLCFASAENNALKDNLFKSSINLKKTANIQLSSYLSPEFKVSVDCPSAWHITKVDTVIKDTSVELFIESEYGVAYVNSRSFSTTFDENISFLFNCLAINGDHNRFLKQVHNIRDTNTVIEMIEFKDTVINYNEELQSGVTFSMNNKIWAGFVFSTAKAHLDQSITIYFLPQYYQQVDTLIKAIKVYEGTQSKNIAALSKRNANNFEKQINYNLLGKIVKSENISSNLLIDHIKNRIQFTNRFLNK